MSEKEYLILDGVLNSIEDECADEFYHLPYPQIYGDFGDIFETYRRNYFEYCEEHGFNEEILSIPSRYDFIGWLLS